MEGMTQVKLSTVYLTYGTLLHPLSLWGDPIIVKSCFKETSQPASPGIRNQMHPSSVSNLTANV